MKKMNFLRKNDKIGIISPAGRVTEEDTYFAISTLKSWGFEPVIGENCFGSYGCFSGKPERRKNDLQAMLDSDDIKAIFCTRGGYGLAQIINDLSFEKFKKNPKMIIGYSDVTVLHNAMANLQVPSVHAPMLRGFSTTPANILNHIKNILVGEFPTYRIDSHPLNRCGEAKGEIVGGNLSVFFGLRGTRFDLDFKNKILFIEDIAERAHQIDRILWNLKIGGVFEQISGLIVGQFTNCLEDESLKQTIHESIANIVDEYNFPVCFNFPAGHVDDNYPIVFGIPSELKVEPYGAECKFL